MNEQERIQQALSLSLTAGYHLDEEAYELLTTISKREDPAKLIELTLKKMEANTQKPLFISKRLLEEMATEVFGITRDLRQPDIPTFSQPSGTTAKTRKVFHPLAKNIKKDITVLDDPTGKICSTSSIDEYRNYFQDRFRRIVRLLRQRMDSRSAGTLRDVFRAQPRSKVKAFCMVTEKRESKFGVFLTVEDPEHSTTVLVPRNGPLELLDKTKSILPDQVVCLNIQKGRKNYLIAEEILLPDIPQKEARAAKESIHAALISDLHVGSHEFMREEFNNFLLWLNGKHGSQNLKEVAGSVKYVIIAGDLVDGVGIYPNQIRELAVRDIYKQYEITAKFLEQIPDYIEIIILPGNHDASRKALPQPAIPKEYAAPLLESENLVSLGNPAVISIHGVRLLVHHGRSLDDVLATAADMNFHSPERAMRLLLQGRHLAPTYGQRTSIASEKRDFLVIEKVPDIYHSGHVHVMKYDTYKGTLMVNSGAWQRQTAYQRNLGLEPTPGIIPVVNLQTKQVLPIDFNG